MADLETAAEGALVRVKEFEARFEKAQASFAALRDEATTLRAQLESDWTGLAEAAQSLIRSAEEHRKAFDTDGQEAAQALAGLGSAVGGAVPEAQQELQGATGEVAGLGERVEGERPRLEAAEERLRALADDIASRADQVERQLAEALREARDFVGVEVAADLQAIEDAIRQRAASVQSVVAEQCTQAIEDAYADFESKLDELEQLVSEKAFEEPGQHVDEVVQFSVQEAQTAHKDALDALVAGVDALEAELRTLEEDVKQHAADVEGEAQTLDGEVEGALALADAMTGAVRALRELIASYGLASY
jgi:chromosome segregation ATPase